MGETKAKRTLINIKDTLLASAGVIKDSENRKAEVDAVVDTGVRGGYLGTIRPVMGKSRRIVCSTDKLIKTRNGRVGLTGMRRCSMLYNGVSGASMPERFWRRNVRF
jgi:hypothetical protein